MNAIAEPPVQVRDPIAQYARDVCSGAIVAGRPVRLACERHLRDLEIAHERGLWFDLDAALYAISFFGALRLADGEHSGEPFALLPWQQFVVGSLFGWKRDDGYRRFRTAYIEIGKGSGKTPLAAGIGWYGLIADGEDGAEIYSAAVSREQAGILFRDATRFREASPALRSATVQHANNVSFPARGSFLRPISSEGRGLDGKRVHMALIDELHEHPSSVVVDKMRAGTKGRKNALIVEITNSGHDFNSVCWQHHQYSLQVLEGTVKNDSWFAYVCALDEGDDWLNDESCWPKTNPSLGTTIDVRYLRELVAEARAIPSKHNIVARLNFCVWTRQRDRWLDIERWNACGAHQFDEDSLRGRECYAGLDLSSVSDLTAFGLVFPPVMPGEPVKVLLRAWVPEEQIAKRVARDMVPYADWARAGWLRSTPGNVVDYDHVRQTIEQDAQTFDIREIAIDRWNATQITTQLMDAGLNVIAFGQGFASMSAPSKDLEARVQSGTLAHGNNPVLTWCASNVAKAEDPAGNIKPDKHHSGEKIDGIVAIIMGLARMNANVQGEDVGIVVIG